MDLSLLSLGLLLLLLLFFKYMQITLERNVTFSSYLMRGMKNERERDRVLVLFLVNLLRVLYYYYCDVAVAAINCTVYTLRWLRGE